MHRIWYPDRGGRLHPLAVWKMVEKWTGSTSCTKLLYVSPATSLSQLAAPSTFITLKAGPAFMLLTLTVLFLMLSNSSSLLPARQLLSVRQLRTRPSCVRLPSASRLLSALTSNSDGFVKKATLLPSPLYHPSYTTLLSHPTFTEQYTHLLAQVQPSCPLGYSATPPSPKTLVAYTTLQKDLLTPPSPTTLPPLLLVKVGEFYESYGIDSLLLIHLAGLNPMGSKLRAGMPLANLQQTINAIFSRWHALNLPYSPSIAVYEEDGPPPSPTSPYKTLKPRHLTQILIPTDSEYTHNNLLAEPPPPSTPYPLHGRTLPIISPAATGGYTYICLYPTTREYRYIPSLTAEAVKTFLRLDGSNAVTYIPTHSRDYPPILYSRTNATVTPLYSIERLGQLRDANLPTIVTQCLEKGRLVGDPEGVSFEQFTR